jgi:hypothetical protein
MLPQEIIHGLGWDGPNQTWKATHMLLDASIEAEIAQAVSKDNKGEDRAWYAGRADALMSFKEILVNTRNEILLDQGRPPNDNGSS